MLKTIVRGTTDAFRKRWNNYKNNARKFLRGESCMQQHLFEHFRSPGHTGFVEDVCITFIDKTRKCLVVRVIFAALYR